MKSIKFKSNKSSILASYIDSLNTRLKNDGREIDRFSITTSSNGRASAIIYYI